MNELEFYNQQYEKYRKYDRQRSEDKELNLDRAEDYFEDLVKSYSDIKGALVDLGCGDGYFTSRLAEFNGTVVGIESSSLINAANELLETSKINNLQFLKENAYQLSLDDNSVELVISRRGPGPEKEIFRVLKPNGIFVFITIGEQDSILLKEFIGRGQHFGSSEKVTDQLKDKFRKVGFSEALCKNFHYDDDFRSGEDLKEFLHQVPIFDNFSATDYPFIDEYCKKHKGNSIKLNRHRIVLFAKKPT